MKKTILLLGFLFAINSLFGLYYSWNVEDAFTYYLVSAKSNSQNSLLLNRASLFAKLNLDDNANLQLRVKDDVLNLTNRWENRVYLEQLSAYWKGSFFQINGGREYFQAESGRIIGMYGDGLNADGVFVGNLIQFWAFSTSLIPPILNTVHLTLEDYTNTSQRLIGGLRWSRNDLLGDETALGAYLLYDYRNTNSLYQPWYVELNQNGAILSSLAYKASLYYEGGVNGQLPIFAYAGEVELLWNILQNPGVGLVANLAFASGDSNRTGLYPSDITNGTDYQFIAPGNYENGLVLYPTLSNLFAFRLSAFLNLKNNLSAVLNLASYNKMNPNAPMSDINASQNAINIGTEISTSVLWHLDYSLDLSLSGGMLIRGEAYADRTTQYKLMSSVSVKI